MQSGARIVELVDEANPRLGELHLFWVRWTASSSRADAATQIRDSRNSRFIVPVIVRSMLFQSPNSVLSDVLTVVSEHREEIESAQRSGCVGPVCIVLLARDEFVLPQVSSPVELPLWFPSLGGMTVHSEVRDLLHVAEIVLLNAPEANVEELSAAIWALEATLVARLERADGDVAERVLKRGFKDDRLPDAVAQRLALCRAHIDGVPERRAYRISVANDGCLSALLIRALLKTTPDQWAGVASDLAGALAAEPGVAATGTLLAVLFRSVLSKKQREDERFAHSLLLTLYGAYQFTTGAAHAGEYPRLPVSVISAVSRDLRRGLVEAAARLA